MSVSVEDVSSPLSDGQSNTLNCSISKSSSESHSFENKKLDNSDREDKKNDISIPSTPKPNPMAFTIDFGDNKNIDNRRLEELAKKSHARHQRVQSMSASFTKSSSTSQKPPLSGKLPRKTQGYNSEGYFSSDQEDSGLSGSVKLRKSPLAQNSEKLFTTFSSPTVNKNIASPENDILPYKRVSKSPIVDSIMSRSDNFTMRQSLNLPLKNPNSSYLRDFHRTPSYGTLPSSYQLKHQMSDIVDNSPEGAMLTDISSPELDILTPDNGLSTPEYMPTSPMSSKIRPSSDSSDLLFKKCTPKVETFYIENEDDNQSDNSSTGTYTIEADNYTEEQKARMSIDRTFGTVLLTESIGKALNKHSKKQDRDPELITDLPVSQKSYFKETKKDPHLRSPLSINKTFDLPSKLNNDKNVLEISCCYESPTDNDLAVQTSKQIKSTRSYLEKIKNRVKTITDKTFPKSPPKYIEDEDVGSFTSVTTSGVLNSKIIKPMSAPYGRRCSLTKSEIDQTDFIHRLSRESSVPVCLPSNKGLPFDGTKFESTVLKNAHKSMRTELDMASELSPDHVVGKLSYLSLNRCKGDKTWIQDWADSVKKYNKDSFLKDTDLNSTFSIEDDKPPVSPRHVKSCSPRTEALTKIPSPVGTLLKRRTPDVIPQQDTESYLIKTQNAITNLQAKLQSSRNCVPNNIPPQLTSSLISEKTMISRLPVSQLSRSNSLNYRLRRKEHSNDSSPLRSPGHYVITGSNKIQDGTLKCFNSNSRSLDADVKRDSNMNSPCSDRALRSNSSDDKTLSNRQQYDVNAILSPHRKVHSRHKSFDGRNTNDYLNNDINNPNRNVCLKTVLKNNALEAQHYPRIEQTRCLDTKNTHHRVLSDGTNKHYQTVSPNSNYAFGMSIKRSSSFSTVNKNNNYIEPARVVSRRSSGNSDDIKDYLSDDSDNASHDKSQESRYKRNIHRGRIDIIDVKSIAPVNSTRCPNTPEMHRKFGPGLVRNSVRVTNKERAMNNNRMSEPPISREERSKPSNHQSRRITEPTRQAVMNRLTKSRSSTRETSTQKQDKGSKKPAQYRSSTALATKEVEFSNWKKRSSYDPAKAAQEGKRRQIMKRQECNKDDLSSPSHSSPVHRSQSFHTTSSSVMAALGYSSGSEEEPATLPIAANFSAADLMISSTRSDVLPGPHYTNRHKSNQPTDKYKYRAESEKRKTFILDDVTPTKENIDFLPKSRDNEQTLDKRKTFILDNDTNSTTNGSSPRNSSIFSHEKVSLTTNTSDTEGESGTESAPVVLRHPNGRRSVPANPKQRYSGDYSMSSSTTSISQQKKPERIQPRYLDISKYKSENTSKNFLRRDPSRTYVAVLNHNDRASSVSKGSAQQYEMEQKKQELEKWKRRASYDPRKSAALGKTAKTPPKTASSVLRSQSFNGPMLTSTNLRYPPPPTQITENYDQSSDNDF